MNIRGRLLDRIGQDQVDELDDGCILRSPLQLSDVDRILLRDDLEVAIVKVGHDIVERCASVVVPFDRPANGLLRGDHDFHIIAGEELDIVNGKDVGGI